MKKYLAFALACLFYLATGLQAAEVRKLGRTDIQFGPSNSTWTSPGGKTGIGYFPYPYAGAGTSSTDNAAVIDVRAYGAVGDGVTSDNAAITAAIAALDNGTEIRGKLFFPKGVYIIDNVALGNGTKNVALEIEGMTIGYGSYIPNGPVILKTTSATGNLFSINMGSNSSGLYIHGFVFQHPADATGVSLDFIGSNGANFIRIEGNAFYHSGIGVYLRQGAVTPEFRDNDFYDTTTAGLRIGTTTTSAVLDHNYFQQGAGNGILIDSGATFSGHSRSDVFQSNTGVDIQLNGSLQDFQFDALHWEDAGSDFIRLTSGQLIGILFNQGRFQGHSSGARNVINDNAANGTNNITGQNIRFTACSFAGLNGGKILASDNEPDGTGNDPGYTNVTVDGGYSSLTGVLFQGVHPATVNNPGFIALINSPFTCANVKDASYGPAKPPCYAMNSTTQSFASFTDNDATPAVDGGNTFTTANTGATTITAFDNGAKGQRIDIVVNDNNTTFDFSGTTLKGNGLSDFVAKIGDFLSCIFNGTNWYCDVVDNNP